MAQGKVQHAGVSGLTPAEVRMAHDILPLTLVELEWSLFARHHEAELLPTCRELGIGILAYRCACMFSTAGQQPANST